MGMVILSRESISPAWPCANVVPLVAQLVRMNGLYNHTHIVSVAPSSSLRPPPPPPLGPCPSPSGPLCCPL